jgi:hypothetical protein
MVKIYLMNYYSKKNYQKKTKAIVKVEKTEILKK